MKILTPNWPKPNNIQALVTLKNFTNHHNYLENNHIFKLEQKHDINILPANTDNIVPNADGSFTHQKNLICIVKTADCLPILITNKQGTFVAALHAGWRGLAKGIIANFFKQTKDLNLDPKDLLFWFGPAIGKNAFEVGEDLLECFGDLYKPAFTKIKNNNINNNIINNKYLANIYKLAEIALNQFSINNTQIFSQNFCTYSQADLFYSYRRDPLNPNRMHSLIWIN